MKELSAHVSMSMFVAEHNKNSRDFRSSMLKSSRESLVFFLNALGFVSASCYESMAVGTVRTIFRAILERSSQDMGACFLQLQLHSLNCWIQSSLINAPKLLSVSKTIEDRYFQAAPPPPRKICKNNFNSTGTCTIHFSLPANAPRLSPLNFGCRGAWVD